METWIIAVSAVALSVAVVLVVIAIFRRWSNKGVEEFAETTRVRNGESLQSGIAKLHVAYEANNRRNSTSVHDVEKRKVNYYVLRRELSMKPYFNWGENPSLVSEAVEHGWSRFAFGGHNMASPSTRSKLLGVCVSSDQAREGGGADISWEICLGSAEYMQKVRLNSGLKKVVLESTPPLGASCVTQTALPLPGPFLGNACFPQEAYFEITVLSTPRESRGREKNGEGEKSKLVNADAQSDEVKLTMVKEEEEEGRGEIVPVSLGLSVGGSHPRRLPGSYVGSIGFNSDGSVYLDGIKLVCESEKGEWGNAERVIGCGFDPSQKKVFFTLDSELVHVIQCKSEEFSRPLYPTLAANMDIALLVNFGQNSFHYAPANLHRTPNPCFVGSLDHSATLGYEDSKELFSMGRIDSEWLNRCATRSNQSTINIDPRNREIDEESEADLFEIVLDHMKRSPSIYS